MSDDQPRDRLGRFSQRLADDAAATAAGLEDPALTEARNELNEDFRAAVSGQPRKKLKRPGPDASREEWEAYVDEEYGWNKPAGIPPGAADAGERGPDRDSMVPFGEQFNDMLRERRFRPKKDVEVIQLG